MNGIRLKLCLQGVDLGHQLGAACFIAIGRLGLEFGDLFRPWPSQRHPTRQRQTDSAAHGDIGGRA